MTKKPSGPRSPRPKSRNSKRLKPGSQNSMPSVSTSSSSLIRAGLLPKWREENKPPKCPITGTTWESSDPVVDHDHSTGEIRVSSLDRLTPYLERSRITPEDSMEIERSLQYSELVPITLSATQPESFTQRDTDSSTSGSPVSPRPSRRKGFWQRVLRNPISRMLRT